MTRAYVYPMDEWACGHYRMIWPAKALQAQGYDVRVVMPGEQRGITVYIDGDHVFNVRYPEDANVLVFQRVTHHHLAHAIGWLVERGVPCIVDVDDDLGAIHPDNPAWRAMHPRNAANGGLHSWQYLNIACKFASMVTVSSEALIERYAPHGRGVVLHNRIPRSYLDIGKAHRDSDTIGWPGSLHSHPDDPAECRTAISRLVREGADFMIAGEPMHCGKAFGLEGDPRGTGGVALEKWPETVSQIGIGVAPLARSRFNRAKSWLKPLEMSAVGVPWVASHSPEYVRLYHEGCGRIALKPKDWYRELRRLQTDSAWRWDLAHAGMEVAARYTVEGGAGLWAQAWGLDSARVPVLR